MGVSTTFMDAVMMINDNYLSQILAELSGGVASDMTS
jgi:hypothetical protein